VRLISFGGGLRAKAFRLKNTFVVVSPLPTEGAMIPDFASAEHFRKKSLIITAGGPLTNIVASLAGLAVALSFRDSFSTYQEYALSIWIVANGLVGIGNLFIFTDKTPFGTQVSDGAQIWGLRKMTDDDIRERLRSRAMTLGLLEYNLGDKERARAIIDHAIEADDGSTIPASLASAAMIDTGQQERSIAFCRAALDDESLDPIERAIVQNNLAFALYRSSDPDALDEADRLSASALDLLPMLMPVRGTRGSILIAMRRYEEGINMLTDKRFRLESDCHQATVSAIRARGLAELGRQDEARKLIRSARKLDPENEHIAVAETAGRCQERGAGCLQSRGFRSGPAGQLSAAVLVSGRLHPRRIQAFVHLYFQ
jgi:tetratricopeptide (TPR) repeat protein